MNILIISRSPWSMSDNFGNTFRNLFERMNDVEIYHICCQHGTTDGSLAKETIQLTDNSVLLSLIGRDCAKYVRNNECEENNPGIAGVVKGTKAKRMMIFHIARDMIWKIGKWKTSRTLNSFLEKNRIDIIYCPIFASCYMCDIQLYLIDRLKVPVVAHITDDVYQQKSILREGIIKKGYKHILQNKLKKLISKASYIEVFAKNMKEEYEAIFNKKCYVIGKGINPDTLPLPSIQPQSQCIKVVYTGNVGQERYKIIGEFARAIEAAHCESSFVLEVYTKDYIDAEIKEVFDRHRIIRIMGAVSGDTAKEVQQKADYLLHVESYSNTAIEATKMSFSTKIIDYMCTGKPIIAIGPYEVNSISFLKDNNLAITVTQLDELPNVVDLISKDMIGRKELADRVRKYLISERDIKKIQYTMLERMKRLCS